MKPSLILGSDAILPTRKVFESFLSGKLLDVDEFHPVMLLPDLSKNIKEADMELLRTINLKYLFENKSHSLKKSLYKDVRISSLFFDEEEGTSIIDRVDTHLTGEFEEAISLLEKTSSWLWELFSLIIKDIWFLEKNDQCRFIGGGGSNYRLIGLFTMSFRPEGPFQILDLVIAMAHELGHNVFFIYQAGKNPILEKDWGKWVYSGVRKVERPAYASFHALVALGYMLVACRGMMTLGVSREQLDYLVNRENELKLSLQGGLSLFKSIQVSDLGVIILNDLATLLYDN